MLAGLGAIQLLAALVPLNGRPRYIHDSWFLISVANLVVICLMVAVFVAALFVHFPHAKNEP